MPMVWDVWGRDQPASDLLSTFDMNRLLLLFLRKSTGVFRLIADGAIKEISVSARDQLKTQLDCTRARALDCNNSKFNLFVRSWQNV